MGACFNAIRTSTLFSFRQFSLLICAYNTDSESEHGKCERYLSTDHEAHACLSLVYYREHLIFIRCHVVNPSVKCEWPETVRFWSL